MPPEVVNNSHAAPGQLAGFLFQPERALYHLANSGQGAFVGIETWDDVTVVASNGTIVREQDKHAVSDATPLTDRSDSLWKTLDIWSSAVDSDEIDLDLTELFLATNQEVSEGIVRDLRDLAETAKPSDLQSFVLRLREAGEKPSKQISNHANAVLAHSDEYLARLLGRIRVIDATCASFGTELRASITAKLHLPDGYSNDILNGLLGWIHDTAVALIRQKEPAWFSYEDFRERYHRELFAHSDRHFFRETAAAEIPVSDKARADLRHHLFVKQLLWIGIEESDEQLIDAIDSYYRSTTEAIRLAKKGVVTPREFGAFEDRLVEKWKAVRRSIEIGSPENVGRAVLNGCMAHREALAGQATHEWYLTQGAFHKLADAPYSNEPRVGWHPKYKERLKDLNTQPI